MNKKIFRASLLVALLVLTASIVLIMGILYEYFETQLKNELKSEAAYISIAIENEGISYFENIDGEERITLITPDGKVIVDTEANSERLENHLDREEIQQALKNGSGTSIRYSDTLTEKTIYYAVKLQDGNILRVSAKQYTVVTLLLGLAQPIAVVLIVALILSFVLSMRLSKSIVQPINQLDLEQPENNTIYEELAPLLTKISSYRSLMRKIFCLKKNLLICLNCQTKLHIG